jgi:hypothetical protein
MPEQKGDHSTCEVAADCLCPVSPMSLPGQLSKGVERKVDIYEGRGCVDHPSCPLISRFGMRSALQVDARYFFRVLWLLEYGPQKKIEARREISVLFNRQGFYVGPSHSDDSI